MEIFAQNVIQTRNTTTRSCPCDQKWNRKLIHMTLLHRLWARNARGLSAYM